MDEITYSEKCACESSTFCSLVNESDDFSASEKNHLVKLIVADNFTRILYVSGILAVWSVVAASIDSILFPGIIIYAIFRGTIDYKVLTPPVLFLVGNATLKFFYISRMLKGKVNFGDMAIAALPYAGSAYLLKKFLINDKLLTRAIGMYLGNKKTQFKKQIQKKLKI